MTSWHKFAWAALLLWLAACTALALGLNRKIDRLSEAIEALTAQQSQPRQSTSWDAKTTREQIESPKATGETVRAWLEQHFLRVDNAQKIRPPIEEE